MNDKIDNNAAYPILQVPRNVAEGQTVSEEITESADRMLMYKYQTNGNKKNVEENKASLQNQSVATSTNNSPIISQR